MMLIRPYTTRMKGILAATAALAALCIIGAAFSTEDPDLAGWRDFSRKHESKSLVKWLKCKAEARLTGAACREKILRPVPAFYGKLGVFITLAKGKKVRGCYGAFDHKVPDLETLLSDYLDGALSRDPRHPPLDVSELPVTDCIITVTAPPFPVADVSSIDFKRYGVSFTCDNGETSVFVPAEIKSAASVQQLIVGRICQISVFEAVTIR
jgi:AMMECR1 domain-containing protein